IGVGGRFTAGTVRHFFVRVQCSVAEKAEDRAVIVVGALFSDHIDGSAFGTAVLGGEALGADLKFLHSFERKLHHRSADGVVLVIDTIDGNVYIATTLAV